jgi:hypothetical protein
MYCVSRMQLDWVSVLNSLWTVLHNSLWTVLHNSLWTVLHNSLWTVLHNTHSAVVCCRAVNMFTTKRTSLKEEESDL